MSDIQVEKPHWELVVERYGKATVAHLLELPLDVPPDSTDIPRQNIVKHLAASFGEQLMSVEQRLFFLCSRLAFIMPGHDMTFTENVRKHIGGRLPKKPAMSLSTH